MAKKDAVKKPPLPYSRKALLSQGVPMYVDDSLAMISLPLGGIGTGTIGLGGRGDLRDWAIFNRPAYGHTPPFTLPFVFAKQGKKKVARILERQLLPPHHGSHGLSPGQLSGLPRLKEAVFLGTYPVARIFFEDDDLPVTVQLEAFNPMIPGNADDSAIPAVILVYRVTNPTRKPVSGSIAWSVTNNVGLSGDGIGGNVNAFRDAGDFRGIAMTGTKHKKSDYGYGSQALVTTAAKVTWATDWDEPGHRFDMAQRIWDDYRDDGRLDGPKGKTKPSAAGRSRVATVAAEYNLQPGKSTEIVFIHTWSFPQRPAQWFYPKGEKPRPVRNHYARKFPDAWRAARYVVANFDRLHTQTLKFEQALFDSTLPACVLDAVSSQMSIIRTNTTMWLDSPTDEKLGRIFAFEGCSPQAGCCPMNCTHVWNYEQSLAHLYPSLERTMRVTDYEDNVHGAGAMTFRTMVPLRDGLKLWATHLPAADGQFGTVVKAYREWRISGDTNWLRRLWPAIRKSITFAWKGAAKWDADKDGVMEGIQHNTYDIEFHGPNTMCGSLYLAALKAGVEMAEAVGDAKAADEFAGVLEKGAKNQDRMLYNGEYYYQRVTEQTKATRTIFGTEVPAGRPKYQYGHGCLADQLLGQWAAHVAGIGYVLPEDHVRSAMAAVFRHNFKADLSTHESVQRTYAVNEEGGLVICTWPNGRREKFPFIYSDEVWTGIEYQVAAHLIYEGMMEEGLTIVAALRDRHDGIARNPWNEPECGDHYARAMASWSVLLAFSGQQWDGRDKSLTVRPVLWKDDFRCIYTAADAYGTFAQKLSGKSLAVSVDCGAGKVGLKELRLAWPKGAAPKALTVRASLDGQRIKAAATVDRGQITVTLGRPVTLTEGDELKLRLR